MLGGTGGRSPDTGRGGENHLAGTFVMPGIVNLHAHIGNTVDLTQDAKFYTRENIEKNLKTCATYGVTTISKRIHNSDPSRMAAYLNHPTLGPRLPDLIVLSVCSTAATTRWEDVRCPESRQVRRRAADLLGADESQVQSGKIRGRKPTHQE
jgi:hypothetical protein